jgi:uncharacterized membrane protein
MRRRLGGTYLLAIWERLRTSFWFVPAVMTAAAVGLSFASVELDRLSGRRWTDGAGWIWTGSPEGAREVLSTIAGSMITVAGVVFSITIVALTLASNQFGPRLLRNFVRDPVNQLVLGTFISTYVYCLLVLRSVHVGEESEFVPSVSVTLGLVTALASLGVLIYFIHHIATSIQADALIASVAHELCSSIEHMFPDPIGEPAPETGGEDSDARLAESDGAAIAARDSGYLQTIDADRLMELAIDRDLILRLERVPGEFVIAGATLVRASPADRVDSELAGRLLEAFIQGRSRTPTQDPEYGVHQLVEVAVRALSPGINDPFTAMTCLHWLGAALSDLARRRIPSPLRRDRQGGLRVIASGSDFPAMADAAFNQIRQYGRGSVSVILCLLDTIAAIAPNVERPADRECLRVHADKCAADALNAIGDDLDRATIADRHGAVLHALGAR